MNILAEYWKERCELAEKVIADLNKGPIETTKTARVFQLNCLNWVNFKRTAIICDDVDEECSEEERKRVEKWR